MSQNVHDQVIVYDINVNCHMDNIIMYALKSHSQTDARICKMSIQVVRVAFKVGFYTAPLVSKTDIYNMRYRSKLIIPVTHTHTNKSGAQNSLGLNISFMSEIFG